MKTQSLPTSSLQRSGGFTLMEILIVVVIISILAVTVVPQFMDEPDRARVSQAQATIKNLETSLSLYKLDNFTYPSTSQGLEALVSKPSGSPEAKNWKPGGYINKLLDDPWGQPYQYLNPGNHGEYDVYSLGADGQPGGEGINADIGNW